jgi:hypothetical protein
MEDITIEVNLGSVITTGGSQLTFSLKIKNSGTGFLQIYARDSDGRRSGTVLFLNEIEYNELKKIMNRTEQTIQDLRQSGRMNQMKFLS